MKTINEMIEYLKAHKYEYSPIDARDNLSIIIDNLTSTEEVKCVFGGTMIPINNMNGRGNFAESLRYRGLFTFAVTNKRIMFAKKSRFSNAFKAVLLRNVNDAGFTKQWGIGTDYILTIDTFGETISIQMSKSHMNAVKNDIMDSIM